MLRRKTATYALLAIYEIAMQNRDAPTPKGVRAGDIAQKHKLPKAYAAKILSQLAAAGILHSDRGPRGGFRLNRPAESITLFDVFDGVGALVALDRRDDSLKGMPPSVQRAMNRTYEEAGTLLKNLFLKTSLTDILDDDG